MSGYPQRLHHQAIMEHRKNRVPCRSCFPTHDQIAVHVVHVGHVPGGVTVVPVVPVLAVNHPSSILHPRSSTHDFRFSPPLPPNSSLRGYVPECLRAFPSLAPDHFLVIGPWSFLGHWALV